MLAKSRRLLRWRRGHLPQPLVLRPQAGWQSQEVQPERCPFTKVHGQEVFEVVHVPEDQRRAAEAVASHNVDILGCELHALQLEEKRMVGRGEHNRMAGSNPGLTSQLKRLIGALVSNSRAVNTLACFSRRSSGARAFQEKRLRRRRCSSNSCARCCALVNKVRRADAERSSASLFLLVFFGQQISF